MAGAGPPAISPGLRAAYQARCQEQGAPLAEFLEEVRGEHAPADLRALLDEVEAAVLENIELMAQALPEAEAMAAERAEAFRRELRALRATLETER